MVQRAHGTLGDSLRQVTKANAQIQEVIVMSRAINMASINAGLIAKRVGVEARGFNIVAGELRSFSQWLDRQMDDLKSLIDTQVVNLANQAKGRRVHHLLRGAHAALADKARLDTKLGDVQQRLDAVDCRNRQRWDELGTHINRIARYCGNGTALIRAARIEAVYGGRFISALRQVVEEIEAAVGAIQATLKQLSREVARGLI